MQLFFYLQGVLLIRHFIVIKDKKTKAVVLFLSDDKYFGKEREVVSELFLTTTVASFDCPSVIEKLTETRRTSSSEE